jgi:uncharacterized membrane protein HdeD (DUF308 family)
MDSPRLPFTNRYKPLVYSVLLIAWWIGVWGIADTVIHMFFKGQTMKELAVYIGLVTLVLFVIFVHPEFLDRM